MAFFERCGLEHQLEEEDEPQGRVAFLRLKKRDVIGNINIHNTELSGNEPLRNVRIVARSWFKVRSGFSDVSGNFNLNAKFRTPTLVKMVFENNRFSVRGIATVGVWRLFQPNQRYIGLFWVKDLSNIQCKVDKGSNDLSIKSRDWVLASMLNGAEYFNSFMNTNGIYYNQGRISIWATGLGNYASAPMLKTMNSPFHSAFFASYFLLRGDVPAVASSAIIGIFGSILGDIMIGYGQRAGSSVLIHEVVFHELAHAYHYGLVGTCYWTNYINYIVANGAYGDGTAQHANKVAASEAFAFDVESIVGYNKYPNYVFLPPFTGESYHTYAETSQGYGEYTWIPQGLFYDLYDNTNFNPLNDLTSLPLNSIFDAIDVNNFWECEIDFSMIKNRLKVAYPSDSANIANLFDYHGY